MNKKKSKRKQVKQPYVAPIRGNVHESEKKEKESQIFTENDLQGNDRKDGPKEDKKYKRDANTVQDYYKAWDKFDVDKELDNLEETEKKDKVQQNPMLDNKEKPKPN